MQNQTLAIDFGPTRTKVAHYDERRHRPRLIELGRDIPTVIPSIFYVPKIGEGKVLVGDEAQDMEGPDPGGLIIGLKGELDRRGKKYLGEDRPALDRIELAAELFQTIRRRCEQEVFHGQTITSCRLTVPSVFTDGQRECLRRAAECGGFQNIALVDEPVAAATAWLTENGSHAGDRVLVCDVGGGTTDFGVVRISKGRCSPEDGIAPGWTERGGNDLDRAIWEKILASRSTDREGLEARSAGFLLKIRRLRELLGNTQASSFPLNVVGVSLDVPRELLEQETKKFVSEIQTQVERFLRKCEENRLAGDFPILLVGGAAGTPGLKEAVQSINGHPVFQWHQSEYAVALGAVEIPRADKGRSGGDGHLRITALQVKPSTIPSGTPVTITYTVVDVGGPGLAQVELWRTSGDGSADDVNWRLLHINTASGAGPVSESFADSPPGPGAYWYGIHVLDTAGKSIDERTVGLGPIQVRVAQQPPEVSPERILNLISDGALSQALELTTAAMLNDPNDVAFDLWCEVAFLLPSAADALANARRIHETRGGDVWGACCLGVAFKYAWRLEDLRNVLQPYLDRKTADRYPVMVAAELDFKPEIVATLARMAPTEAGRGNLAVHQAILSGGQPKEMKAALDQVIRSHPRCFFARSERSYMAGTENVPDTTCLSEDLQFMERVSPHHPSTAIVRALFGMNGGDYVSAIANLDKAIADPRVNSQPGSHAQCLYLKTICFLSMQDANGALSLLNGALQLAPDFMAARATRARLLLDGGNPTAALSDVNYLERFGDLPTEVLTVKGWSLYWLGQPGQALAAFRAAVTTGAYPPDALAGGVLCSMLKVSQGAGVWPSATYAWPNIPAEKLQAAAQSYILPHRRVEAGRVLLLYDDTVFGGSKDGLCVTDEAVYWHNQWVQMVYHLELSAITAITISERNLLINGNQISVSMCDNACVLRNMVESAASFLLSMTKANHARN